MTIDVERLRAICEQATQPGPWTVNVNDIGKDGDGHCVVLDAHGMWVADCGNAPADATFIAAARTALPALLDRAQAAEGEVERLTKVLDDRMCKECGGQGEWCVDRCYGNEHYQEMEKCHACNGDGRTEPGAVAEIQRLTARLRECEAERDAARADIEWWRKSRDDWQATAARTATERRSEEMAAIHAAREATADRDRLRAEVERLRGLLGEACGIAQTFDDFADEDTAAQFTNERERIAEIAREENLP